MCPVCRMLAGVLFLFCGDTPQNRNSKPDDRHSGARNMLSKQ